MINILTDALSYVLSPTPTAMTGRSWKNPAKKEKKLGITY